MWILVSLTFYTKGSGAAALRVMSMIFFKN